LVLPNVFIDGIVEIVMDPANYDVRTADNTGNVADFTNVTDGSLVRDGNGNEVGRVYLGTKYANGTAAEPSRVNQGPLGILDKINGLATIQGGISTMPMEL